MIDATLPASPALTVAAPKTPRLRDLLEDGVYLLLLLKSNSAPSEEVVFNERVEAFLTRFGNDAKQFGKDPKAIEHARFAFCALADEIILAANFQVLTDWERNPLQMRHFGEHLGGERFFDHLETLRLDPTGNLETLEVFHTCLLLGFKGKYLLESEDVLGAITQRLGDEITRARGGPTPFAPNWRLPQRFAAYVRNELPLWLYVALLALVGSALFIGYHWMLSRHAASVITS